MSKLEYVFSGLVQASGGLQSVEASIAAPVMERSNLYRCEVRISWPAETCCPIWATTEAEVRQVARAQLFTQLAALNIRDENNREVDPFDILVQRHPEDKTTGELGIVCILEKDALGGAVLRMFDVERPDSPGQWKVVRLYTERKFESRVLAQSPMDRDELEGIGVTVLARLMAFEGL